jgi:hypothetical protein
VEGSLQGQRSARLHYFLAPAAVRQTTNNER